jgi:hypothetical protein
MHTMPVPCLVLVLVLAVLVLVLAPRRLPAGYWQCYWLLATG